MKFQKKHIEKNEKNQSKFCSTFFLIIFLAGAAAGVYFVWKFFQKPVSSKIYTKSELSTTVAPEVFERFEGKYLSFEYSQTYSIKSHTKELQNGGVILESALLSDAVSSKRIGLTIRNLPTHNLEDCPDFKMRELDKGRYKKEVFDFGLYNGSFFENIEQEITEKTFFLLQGDYLAILSMTGPSFFDEKKENEAMDIIKSISWLK